MKGALNPQALLTVLQWIAKRASDKSFKYWTLAHHITPELLSKAYSQLRKGAAAGVDKQTAAQYKENLSANIADLHQRLEEQRYRASPVRRVWIPKENSDKLRPLGIPTLEDKIVQQAVLILLESIYEAEFYDFSYGYRKGRNCHQALEEIWRAIMNGMQWVIDADISDYFTTIDHAHLREFLGERIADQGIIRLIGKWLNAGVLEDETLIHPENGTPQGGVISPLLANIYLSCVLDRWFVEQVKPRLKGKAFLVRVADDFVIGCEQEEDARRIMEVLPKRLAKYGLNLNRDKTRLLDFRKPEPNDSKGKCTFDFVGFRHYWGKSRKGNWVIKRKTAPKRLRRAMKRVRDWCKTNMHEPIQAQYERLRAKLRGHYNYYGVTGNYRALRAVLDWTERQWFRWLGRRSRRPRSWAWFGKVFLVAHPLPTPYIAHSALKPVQQVLAVGKCFC